MLDKVPQDWEIRNFGDFAKEIKERYSTLNGAPVLSVTKHMGFVKSSDYFKKQVFSEDLQNYKLVKKENFAYATIHLDEGSLGLLTEFEQGYISPMYTVFEVDSSVNKKYLFMLLKTKRYLEKFKALSEGTVRRRKAVKFTNLSKLVVPLPKLPEQDLILDLLSNVDYLIKQTQKTIEEIINLKKGLTSKILTEGLGHTKFKDPRKGKNPYQIKKIPEDWDYVALGDEYSGVLMNGLNKEKEDYGHGCLHVNIENLFEGFLIDPKKLGRVNATDEQIENYQLKKGDICLVRSSVKWTGIGYPALFDGSEEPVVFGGFIIRLRPNLEYWDPVFLTYLLQSHFIRNNVIAWSTRSANININQNSLGKLPLPHPPTIEEQQQIASILRYVESISEVLQSKKSNLETLKKGLMQKLLTGQIRVKV